MNVSSFSIPLTPADKIGRMRDVDEMLAVK